MPNVILVRMYVAFSSKQMEGRKFKVLYRADRPAIVTVGSDELADVFLASAVLGMYFLDLGFVSTSEAGSGLPQCGNGARKGRLSSGPDGCILRTQQFEGFCRPRHQFAVETNPSRLQRFPKIGGRHRRANALENLAFERRIIKEAPAGSRVDDAEFGFSNAEPFLGRLFIAADNYH